MITVVHILLLKGLLLLQKEIMFHMTGNSGYTTGNILDYEYFSKHYKLIAIDLNKQIELENPDLKQHINFTGKHD